MKNNQEVRRETEAGRMKKRRRRWMEKEVRIYAKK